MAQNEPQINNTMNIKLKGLEVDTETSYGKKSPIKNIFWKAIVVASITVNIPMKIENNQFIIMPQKEPGNTIQTIKKGRDHRNPNRFRAISAKNKRKLAEALRTKRKLAELFQPCHDTY